MATHEHEPGEMLTAAELAAELKVSRRTLARWRSEGSGPPFVRVGRSPRYRWADVQAWLRASAGPDAETPT
jgi:excisionase family DNA binding protein